MLVIARPMLNDGERALAWSASRRHHQALARRCHYRAREPTLKADRTLYLQSRGKKAQL